MAYLRGLLVLLIIVAALGVGATVALRVGRTKVAAPDTVKPSIVSVENWGGVYVFAARAGGGRALLFDTGADPDGKPVDVALGALGASRADVTDVFLTHGHGDHTAGAGRLPKAKIHLGAGDVDLAAGKAPPEAVLPRLISMVLPVPPVTATDPLTGATTFDVGDGKTVKALPVPGHTPGSYAYLYDGVLFVGDIMILKQGRLEPPPRVFNPRPAENVAAIRSLKLQLASDTVDIVCTAHGGCTPKGLGSNLLDEIISRI